MRKEGFREEKNALYVQYIIMKYDAETSLFGGDFLGPFDSPKFVKS